MTHRLIRIALTTTFATSSALLVACAPAVPSAPTAAPSAAVSAPPSSPAPAPTLGASVGPSVAAPSPAPAKPAASPPATVALSPSPVRVSPSPSIGASPVAAAAPAAGSAAAAGAAPPGDATRGQQVFVTEGCHACHGTVGQGASTGPKLAPGPLPFAAVQQQVRQPRQDMPRFAPEFLSDQDLADLYAYLQSIQPGAAPTAIPLLNR